MAYVINKELPTSPSEKRKQQGLLMATVAQLELNQFANGRKLFKLSHSLGTTAEGH